MNNILQSVMQNGTTINKAVFLMACGVFSVFAAQLVFYLIAKLWPRGGKEK